MSNILKANITKLKQGAGMYRPPFGYDITDGGNLVPIEEDLELLKEIAEMLEQKAMSLRDGALYITMKSSRSITYEGLRKRLMRPVRLEEELEDGSTS